MSARRYEQAAAVLTELMESRAVSAAELSRTLEIDAGILRKILTGRQKSISTRNLLLLSRYFGRELRELIDRIS